MRQPGVHSLDQHRAFVLDAQAQCACMHAHNHGTMHDRHVISLMVLVGTMSCAFAAVLLFVLLTCKVTAKGNGYDGMMCQYQYTLVPSTTDIIDCTILGVKVQLVCQVVGPPNHNLSISWHRETDKANAGHTRVPSIADGEYGYEIAHDPMLEEQSKWNISIITSTLTISDVTHSDLAYFWCRVDADGFTEPKPGEIILLSKSCDPSAPPCEGRKTLPDGTILLSLGADICTDDVSIQQPPDPPACPSQLPPHATLAHSISVTTHTRRSSRIDSTPLVNPDGDPPQSSGSHTWRFIVIGIAATFGAIIFTVVSVMIVFRASTWHRKKNHPIHVQSCTAYGKTFVDGDKRKVSTAETNCDTTGEVFYDTIPDVTHEKSSQPGSMGGYYDDVIHGNSKNSYRESVNEDEYESVIDDDSESYLEIIA